MLEINQETKTDKFGGLKETTMAKVENYFKKKNMSFWLDTPKTFFESMPKEAQQKYVVLKEELEPIKEGYPDSKIEFFVASDAPIVRQRIDPILFVRLENERIVKYFEIHRW